MKKIKKFIKSFLKTFALKTGLKTNKKIIVFESDDWGADRNYSKENFDNLLKKHPEFKPDPYQKFDILETDEDVENLKQTLLSVQDSIGNPCVFTLNFAMFNLDFENNKNFELVPISKYYESFKKSKNVLKKIKEGINQNCFCSQLHAREHISIERLKSDLQSGNELVKDAFDLKIIGVNNENYSGMDTLNIKSESSQKMLKEAMCEFEKTFNFVSESFIAPCYTWKNEDEKTLEMLGVKYLQGGLFQNRPIKGFKTKRKFHRFGKKSKVSKLVYFHRNVSFEPTRDRFCGYSDEQILNNTMQEIRKAFKNNKPAVICTHRVNYVCGIDVDNGIRNNKLLKELLNQILVEFKDVVFMDTPTMCKEMLKK